MPPPNFADVAFSRKILKSSLPKPLSFLVKSLTCMYATLSIILFTLSILLVFFKGLNYGIDFKGGTLIELRTDKSIKASSIRDILSSMNLGDVNVKKFGKDPFTSVIDPYEFQIVQEYLDEGISLMTFFGHAS